MPPRRAHGTGDSNSESESRDIKSATNTNSRSSAKARNLALQQAQKELLARHINSNGPQDREPIDPLDFEKLDDQELRNYAKYHLQDFKEVKSCLTLPGYLLESKIGEKTYSFLNKNRVSKKELAGVCKRHFNNLNVKETEVITNFIYKVNNQDKLFKLKFNKSLTSQPSL